jgi:hypothetical protein
MSCRPIGSHPLPTVPVSGQPRGAGLLSHTIAACMHAFQVMMIPPGARLIDASVMRERAIETREPSCVPRAARPFFILVVHSSL